MFIAGTALMISPQSLPQREGLEDRKINPPLYVEKGI